MTDEQKAQIRAIVTQEIAREQKRIAALLRKAAREGHCNAREAERLRALANGIEGSEER